MKYYVILTGSKNNAGDYLIKHRAKQLFNTERPDRKVIDLNAWEPFDNKTLDLVNNSEALILMGGPALQYNMWPGVYKLTDKLELITVPIILMGIGWYSSSGNWNDTYNYPLNEKTLQLLSRVDSSGFQSSVRDYHTLSVLRHHNFKNIIMTGCPAYYDYDYLNNDLNLASISKVGFSLGVSFINSSKSERIMKETILKCRDYYGNNNFTVAFHHSLDKKTYLNVYNNFKHIKKHQEFARWLNKNNISYKDISGSADSLINFYSNVDLHVGFRVHAHIYMNSVSKPSILLTEDGRGKAINKVIGGVVIDGIFDTKDRLLDKALYKLKLNDRLVINERLPSEVLEEYEYELDTEFHRTKISRKLIDQNFKLMKSFLYQLP